VLSIILRGDKTCEETVEAIHEYLRTKAEAIRAGTIPVEKFVITKSLTKAPETYTDAKNQPHVQVALAMKRKVLFHLSSSLFSVI
jgi:DNA polymerase alpha subunit A